MSASFFAGAVLLAQVIHSQPPALTTEAAMAKFDQTCAGKKTPACDQLRWQMGYALYEDMLFLGHTTGTLDDEMVRIGAASDVPQLKAFCLDRIRNRGLQPAEHPLVIAALDDPYPLVRESAQKMVGQLPDEKYSRMLSREPSSSGGRLEGVQGLIAGVSPDAKKLTAAPYPGARYWYFASDRDVDFFTTQDAPEKVLASYAKGGKKALTAAELKAKVKAAMDAPSKDPMAMARMMQEAMAKGGDPQKAMQDMAMGGENGNIDWTKDVEGEDGVVKPRYVILTETKFFGMAIPVSVVAVFKDEIMGGTSLVFRRAPAKGSNPSTEKEIEAFTKRMEILSSPDAQVPPEL